MWIDICLSSELVSGDNLLLLSGDVTNQLLLHVVMEFTICPHAHFIFISPINYYNCMHIIAFIYQYYKSVIPNLFAQADRTAADGRTGVWFHGFIS